MCIPENLIIAIYGNSCTGKTTIAKLLSEKYNLPSRLCGESVREESKKLKISIDQLSSESHEKIDSQTVKWVEEVKSPSVVEGRFLDSVLSDTNASIKLVHIHATDDIRRQRLERRTNITQDLSSITQSDLEDCKFRKKMYNPDNISISDFSFDVTDLKPDECVDQILHALKIRPKEHN